jgi:hypothetical protein
LQLPDIHSDSYERAEKAMINSQPPAPNIQLESMCRDSGGLGIEN